MILDSGVATIKRGTLNPSSAGGFPTYTYTELDKSFYAEKTVSISRFYSAKSQSRQADLLIEIIRNGSIMPDDICEISSYVDNGISGTYKIIQVQHVLDEDNLPKTDLTLERLDGVHDDY